LVAMPSAPDQEMLSSPVGGKKTLLKMKEFEARDGITVPQGSKSIAVQANSATSGLPIVGVQVTDEGDVIWFFPWSREWVKYWSIGNLRFFNEADRGKEEPPLYFRLYE